MIATAPVGTEPQFVVVDPLRGNVFVSNYGGTSEPSTIGHTVPEIRAR